jgi:DNA-binding transcriptional MerR regulator
VHRFGTRGSSDLLSQPTRVKANADFDPIDQLGSDSAELGRFIESSALRDRRLSERDRIILILTYEWGFNLKEIGDLLAVSESRASQLLHSALRAQKKRIQAADASQEERDRQRAKQKEVSREIQNKFRVDEKAARIMEKIRLETNQGVVQETIQKTYEEVRSFAIASF